MNLITKEVQMTSLELSEITGKEHKNILRDIRNEMEALGEETAGLIFEPSNYFDVNNQSRPCYTFGRKGVMQLALKYDAKTRFKVIEKLEELESQLPKMSKELQAIFMVDQKQQQIESRVNDLENNMTIDYGQERNLQVLAQKMAIKSIGGKDTPTYKDKGVRGKVYAAIWRDFKDYFQVASYRNTPKKEYAKAVEFLSKWSLTGKLLREVEDCNNQIQMI